MFNSHIHPFADKKIWTLYSDFHFFRPQNSFSPYDLKTPLKHLFYMDLRMLLPIQILFTFVIVSRQVETYIQNLHVHITYNET
jgi:hypothetical protein